MDIPPEIDNYMKESIEASFGLPISEKNMHLKLVVLEDARHLLQSQVFELEDRLSLAKAEANMNAQGLRKVIEEKEKILSEYAEFREQHAKLEEGFKRTVEACDELERENEEIYASRMDLATQVKSLKVEREQLLENLKKAEKEVVLLSIENKTLENDIKRLTEQFKRFQGGYSASPKVRGKSSINKSRLAGRPIDSDNEDARNPLTPINVNSPELDTFNTSV